MEAQCHANLNLCETLYRKNKRNKILNIEKTKSWATINGYHGLHYEYHTFMLTQYM